MTGTQAGDYDVSREARDLVAVSSLSAYWMGESPAVIARGLAEALVETGFLAASVSLKPQGPEGEPAVFTRVSPRAACSEDQAKRALAQALAAPHRPGAVRADAPLHDCAALAFELGHGGLFGAVAVATTRDAAPEAARLRLLLAANQAALPLLHARLMELAEQREADEARAAVRLAEARADLLRTISHELRAPLTAILGFSQLLEMDEHTPLTAQQQHHVGYIREAGMHLLSLVNDLLDLCRLDARSWEPTPHTFDVRGTIVTVVEEARPAADQRKVGLRMALPDEPLLMTADERLIRQAVTNLVSNAVKFTDRGSVEVRARPDAERLAIAVADTGIGISPADLAHIFDEFAQVGAERRAGSGLGLAITRRIVELLRGSIDVASEPGAGSTFTIWLPFAVPVEEPQDDR